MPRTRMVRLSARRLTRSRPPIYCTPMTRSRAARSPLSRRRTVLLNLGLATGIAGAVAAVGTSSASPGPRAEPAVVLSSSVDDLRSFRASLDAQLGAASRDAAALRSAAAGRLAAEAGLARAARARLVAADLRASRSRQAALLADPRELGRAILTDRGQADQFGCLDSLWTRESNWRVHDTNSSSGAYGIPQSLPAGKLASAGDDWRDNPATQIRWGLGYIADRYGSPCAAWSHSQSYNWY